MYILEIEYEWHGFKEHTSHSVNDMEEALNVLEDYLNCDCNRVLSFECKEDESYE